MEEYIDPVGEAAGAHRVGVPGSSSEYESELTVALTGEVVAVHKKAGHHDEGHVLDTSVGAREYTEIVVRVDSGNFEHLVGKKVSIQVRP